MSLPGIIHYRYGLDLEEGNLSVGVKYKPKMFPVRNQWHMYLLCDATCDLCGIAPPTVKRNGCLESFDVTELLAKGKKAKSREECKLYHFVYG